LSRKLKVHLSSLFLIVWPFLFLSTPANAEDIIINLDATTAYIDVVVNVDTTTAYVITTTTGPRFEVVDSVTVERPAWVDSWLWLYRGVADSTTARTGQGAIAADDDGNSSSNNYWASRLSGTLAADTYTIRATSYDYVVAGQRAVGTYTLSSGLIPHRDTATAVVDTNTVVAPPVVVDTNTVVAPPVVVVPPVVVSEPPAIISIPPAIQSDPIAIVDEIPIAVVPPDIAPEAPIDIALEAPIDIAPEAPIDIAPEAPIDIAPEAPIDIAPEIEIAPPLTVEQIENIVDDLVTNGVLSNSDSEIILDALRADGEITSDEVSALSEALSSDGEFTREEVALVVDAIIEAAGGEAITAEDIKDAGLTYNDLPDATPVEVRQDENGNSVIIVAEVAAALQVLESPAEFISAVFDNPEQALTAVLNIGADMSDEERKGAEEMVVSAIIASNAAINAVSVAGNAAANAAARTATGGTTPKGPSGGGPMGGDPRIRRRKP